MPTLPLESILTLSVPFVPSAKVFAEGEKTEAPVPTVISLGLVKVETPEMIPSPLIDIDIAFPPYTIDQVEPDGMVTVIPVAIPMGPALIAFFPEEIV